MTDVKVTLPEPCSEPWEGMARQGCNRHCATCDTIIHDLSELTLEEAEELLDSAGEVCVRAQLDSSGVVKLAKGGSTRERRMIATVGASLALATAACQTVPSEEKANRFEISGNVPWFSHVTRPILTSSDGRKWRVHMEHRKTSFSASNLYPGVYSLTYAASCGEAARTIENIVIRDSSIDLGNLEGDGGCIFIGQMTRKELPSRG